MKHTHLESLVEFLHLHSIATSVWSRNAREHFGDEIPCRAGCPSCCYLLATCTLGEALVMALGCADDPAVDAAIEQGLRMLRLMEAYGWTAEAGPIPEAKRIQANKDAAKDWHSLAIPCPFLDPASMCTIYAVRPSQCSCTLSLSPAEECHKTASKSVMKEDPLRFVHKIDIDLCAAFGVHSNHEHVRFLPFGVMLAQARRVLEREPDGERMNMIKVVRAMTTEEGK